MLYTEHRNAVVYSGGFDPLHLGHVERILEAKQRTGGDGILIVIVEPDSFVQKKHPVFMPQEERAKIVQNIKGVDLTVCATDEITTADILAVIRPRAYLIGPDHNPADIPERMVCAEHHIHIHQFEEFESGPRSSSKILNEYCEKASKPPKTMICYENPPVTVSAIIINGRKEVLLGVRGGKGKGAGMWDLPGGFLEGNESLEECLVRECREELGPLNGFPLSSPNSSKIRGDVKFRNARYHTSLHSHYGDGRDIVCVYFVCQLAGDFSASEELTQFSWFNCVPDRIFSEADARALRQYFAEVEYVKNW